MKKLLFVIGALVCLLAGCAIHPTDTVSTVPTTPVSIQLPLPTAEPEATVGFAWEVKDGTGFLTGIGTVTQKDIVIPAQVSLVRREDGWHEDADAGTEYPVVVSSDAFYNCSQLRTVTFHSGVTMEDNRMCGDRGGMFGHCANLTAVYNIPDTVVSMDSAFSGCVALISVPKLPAFLEDLTKCFYGCTSLSTAPSLPDSVTDMTACFMGCTSLETVGALPASLITLDRAFAGCIALKTMPTLPEGLQSMVNAFTNCLSMRGTILLPESVVAISNAFINCDGLRGTVTVPKAAAENVENYVPFGGCDNLSEITLTCCAYYCDWTRWTMYHFPARYNILYPHTQEGTCPYCQKTDTRLPATQQMTRLVIDGVSPEYENWFRDMIQNKVPTFLTQTCQEFTLTQNISKYIADENAHRYSGYSTGTKIYVTPNSDIVEMAYTIFHELGHCYDLIQNTSKQVITARKGDRYISYTLGQSVDSEGMVTNLFSASSQWKAICEKEEITVSQWYDQDLFWSLDPVQRRKEAFAISVGKYFTDPDWFMKQCPEMYAYMDNLFRQQLAPEETEPTP